MVFTRLRELPWRSGLLWSGTLLLGAGFWGEHMWRGWPWRHAVEVLMIAGIAAALAGALKRRWRVSLANGLLVVFVIALLIFTGPLPVFATLLAGTAALGLGSAAGGKDAATSIVIGLGLFAGTIGWLLPFPLHVRGIYLLAAVLTIALTRRHIRATFDQARAARRDAVDADPAAAAFAMLVAGLASIGCWIPTVQFDDLAYHLGLPSQLQALGYYRLDAQTQFWALAPWSGDIIQAIVQLLAGAEARGAVDALWLAAGLGIAWQLAAALGLSTRAAWLCVGWRAIFALTGARYVLSYDDDLSPALRAALADAEPVQRVLVSQLWRLPLAPAPTIDLQQQRDAAAAHFRP